MIRVVILQGLVEVLIVSLNFKLVIFKKIILEGESRIGMIDRVECCFGVEMILGSIWKAVWSWGDGEGLVEVLGQLGISRVRRPGVFMSNWDLAAVCDWRKRARSFGSSEIGLIGRTLFGGSAFSKTFGERIVSDF